MCIVRDVRDTSFRCLLRVKLRIQRMVTYTHVHDGSVHMDLMHACELLCVCALSRLLCGVCHRVCECVLCCFVWLSHRMLILIVLQLSPGEHEIASAAHAYTGHNTCISMRISRDAMYRIISHRIASCACALTSSSCV